MNTSTGEVIRIREGEPVPAGFQPISEEQARIAEQVRLMPEREHPHKKVMLRHPSARNARRLMAKGTR